MVALITKMDTAVGGRRSGRTSKRLARLTGLGRIAPAGDETATTPKNSTHGRQTRLTKASNENRPLAEAAATPVPEYRPRRIKIISASEDSE